MTELSSFYSDGLVTLIAGDAEAVGVDLESGSVQTIVTSPPYFGLRDYGVAGQLGAEATVDEYVDRLVRVFRVLRDALADDGTLWLNLGDSYGGAPGGVQGSSGECSGRQAAAQRAGRGAKSGRSKELLGVPWRVALALQADGWLLRSDIIWSKPNPMPESVKDRPTKAHEYLFLFAKSRRYFYDADAIAEPVLDSTIEDLQRRKVLTNKGTHGGARADLGRSRADYVRADGLRNKRTVWEIGSKPFQGAHFAVFPPELVRPCVLAGSRRGDLVLDPFSGSGTTGLVATQEGRRYVGIDLNPEFLELSLRTRFAQPVLDLSGVGGEQR